ncbi:TPA: DNA cytosine methyltransferase [Candidatus Marinimicrobia bacterium]|nr:DNA cytosine methyltransferase [Candidatus Neomarinimicrobiota bacterium]
MEIPVIDIFAGPGGLGEGFSAFYNPHNNRRHFKIALSIEKEFYAYQTLTLRSFFRQFPKGQAPKEYYEFVRGKVTLNELFQKWPKQAQKAKNEAWQAELGDGKKAVSDKIVDQRIQKTLNGGRNWVLIGGPPCQAYSVAGRSRRQEKILDEKKDERVGLYKQYLRILAIHTPAVFVMENVKGLLSANTEQSPVFSKILNDLSNPVDAYYAEFGNNGTKLECPGYKIYSLVAEPATFDLHGNPVFHHQDFIILSERYGVPQARHRVILLGIRKDINHQPDILMPDNVVPVFSVLSGLPKLRSKLSKSEDSREKWEAAIVKILEKNMLNGIDSDVKQEIIKQIKKITLTQNETGGEYITKKQTNILYRPDWYLDEKLEGVCNHASRGHMDSDLLRYFFASCFAKVKNRSPKLEDFPVDLLPAHKNVKAGIEDKKFADRFRVQLWNNPCKTITSHISKDGHYYIHPDPAQCRSFTVREAARIQTFPDNYYFCGPRTAQFIQVGNAVPPLLANQIAGIVFSVFQKMFNGRKKNSNINERLLVAQ